MTEESQNLIKQELAAAYQIFAKLGMDDAVYTHLSARSGPNAESYFIYPFGLFFEEVTVDNLMEVDFNGKILSNHDTKYNKTGYLIHSAIYKQRADINAIFHLHTENGVAISSTKSGLLPLNQFSFLFQNQIGYVDYDSLILDANQTSKSLWQFKNTFLRNHGTISMGCTIQEAFFYAYYLEKACSVQCKIGSQEAIFPPSEICEKARQDMHSFEKNLGKTTWDGMVRKFL